MKRNAIILSAFLSLFVLPCFGSDTLAQNYIITTEQLTELEQNNNKLLTIIEKSEKELTQVSNITKEQAKLLEKQQKRIETVQRDHGTAREIIERNAEIYKQIRTQKE